ncbi:MAG: hypothetical protein AAF206_20115 [Bacteroidota bacterium]
MKKQSTRIIGIILILGLAAAAIGGTMYFKPHADVNQLDAEFQMSVPEVLAAFSEDENSANQKYVDKIIEVKGTVAEINETGDGGVVVSLREDGEMLGVNCAFQPADAGKAQKLAVGTQVSIKGFCSGMLMDVNLNRCVLP